MAGELRWTHDANFRIATEVATGGSASLTARYGYDRDGLQTCASATSCTAPGADALRIAYNAAGQPTTTTLGNVGVNNTYTMFGEQSRMDATFNAYVGNNPISQVDPTGECPWCIAAGVGAVTGAGFDLALQLLQNGGNLGCVSWGSVGTAALTGAALSGLGPTGFLLGRGGPKAARFGYSQTRALLNRGNIRFGWSGPVNGKDVLSYRVGKAHSDLKWTGVPSGANPQRDGAATGLLGGGINRGANGSCGCQ